MDKALGYLASKVSQQVVQNHAEELRKGVPTRPPVAFYEDPLKIMQATGFKEKPTSLSYDILRQMSSRNAVIAAVILTRVNQVSTFTKPSRYSKDGLGYEIRLKNPEDIPDDKQKLMMVAIEEFLFKMGYEHNPKRDGFDTFVRKLVRDSLTYDQMCFEIVPDKAGRPSEVYAVDAATIRASSDSFRDIEGKSVSADWVQILDGTIKASFGSSELAFCVRNPRTDVRVQPYGFSELEQLIQQITSHLYAEDYNSKFFSQGGTTKGIINIKAEPGALNQAQLESFKSQWRAQVSGLTGAWKTPVLQVPQGLEYINVSQSNREMEFEKWMNYLINICCAVYQIDPAEVNFPNNGGVGGTGGGVFESSNEGKIKHSRDKGLRPLLRFLEDSINKHIISRFSQDYVFNFVGIDSQTEQEKVALMTQQVKAFKTINEVRKDNGLEPIDGGDVILDPSFMSNALQREMSQGAGGMPGQEPESDLDMDSGTMEDDPYADSYQYEEDDEDYYEDYGDVDSEFEDEDDEEPEDMEKSTRDIVIILD